MPKSLLFLLTFFLHFNFSTRASHVEGAEMSYQCIGNGYYEVTLSFYRNCFGIPAPNICTCTVSNSCNFPIQYFSLYHISSYPIAMNTVCPGESTSCDTPQGNNLGIEKHTYRGSFLLGAYCEEWMFSTIFSGRSALITTILDPDFDNLFIHSTLNNINDSICNRSPVFTNDPIIIVCKDQLTCINPGLYDADGDSLVCVMTTPLSYENHPLIYMPGYSISQPLTASSPITIDNSTGEICFTPVQQEVSVIALLVNEYRNGIQIGQVKRDIMIYVIACAGIVPELSGFSGDSVYDITVCAGLQNCLPIYSDDADVSDSTVITWDNGIPTASFYNSGGLHDNGLFCWTPVLADVSPTPHCFNATVKDNNCHGSRSRVYQYCVTVVLTDSVCLYINSTGNLNESNKMKIYPQPAFENLYIDFGKKFSANQNYQLQVRNILGETIYHSVVDGQIMNVELSGQTPSGMYFAGLLDEKGNVILKNKFIIRR